MLYVIYGNDDSKARQKSHDLIDALQKKKPDAELFTIGGEHFESRILEELIGGQGLFERKFIVFADHLFRDKAIREVVLEKVKQIAASDNLFILLEDMLDKATKTKLEKHAEKMQEFSMIVEKKEEFKIFSLTEAFGRRDRKSLWVLYQKAVAENVASEEIHGILFWQLKSMLVAAGSKTAEESGLNPYVYRKSVGFSKNYLSSELSILSSKMIEVYHNARRGVHEFDVALERFILEV